MGEVPLAERRRLVRALEDAGRVALATLFAGLVWQLARFQPPDLAPPSLHGPHRMAALTALLAPRHFTTVALDLLPLRTLAALTTYLLGWAGLDFAERKIRRPAQGFRIALLLPLVADVAGWIAGAGCAAVALTAGLPAAGLLLAIVAVLALEAGRIGVLLEKARRRARDLERLRRAGQRMISPSEEMAGVAERIYEECGKVVPSFSWFQFETLTPGSEFRSWAADGPLATLREGVPEPDRYPPPLPGFHRRSPWQILERLMRVDGKVIARLRLWCDPRRLEPQSVLLLDRLLPQMSASVQRCLLDREAREDPLTGLAMRRVLEKRLHEVHARALEEGSAMSIVICDLDHFKRINDTYGHPIGDAALIAVASVLREERRQTDLCCRYGGEEFVLLLDRTDGAQALGLADRIRCRIEELDFQVEGQRVPLTLSAGVASFPGLYIKTAAELLLFADEALYEAKGRGRNRVLLDLGQGRYMDISGNVLTGDEVPAAPEAPRIFA
ncbi:MAG TPA: GGDEF domain-containing protein, partial [Thermoanaerobaculia bacterium]